jgi:hypothetical protein
MARLNIMYDLLQTTEISSNIIEDNEILQPIDKIYFVICNLCYWCASYFGIDDLESISHPRHMFSTVTFVILTTLS